MLNAMDIRIGSIVRLEGAIWKTLVQEVKGTGKFGKTVHLKLRNLEDGNVAEKSLRAEDRVEEVEVRQVKMTYLYKEGDQFIFMNSEDYEQYPMPAKIVGKQEIFLKESSEITVLVTDNRLLAVEFPAMVDLKVTTAPEPIKGHGDSVYKEVELENGLKILVPQFIKEGDRVRVKVEDLSYRERLTVKSMKREKGGDQK